MLTNVFPVLKVRKILIYQNRIIKNKDIDKEVFRLISSLTII